MRNRLLELLRSLVCGFVVFGVEDQAELNGFRLLTNKLRKCLNVGDAFRGKKKFGMF